MTDERERSLARDRQSRKRERDRQYLEDLRKVLFTLAKRHPQDLESAVQELAEETDRDPNSVFDLYRRDSRSHKGRGRKREEAS